MGRQNQVIALMTINRMAKNIIKLYCRSVKWRVTGKRRVAREEKMNSVYRLQNFVTCVFLQVAKIFTTS